METTTNTQLSDGRSSAGKVQVAGTSFLALFSIVGIALYGLPFFYDFMVKDFGWTRAQVTSGNAYSKLLIGPLFGFLAGWIVDRFGPRRMMMAIRIPAIIIRRGPKRSTIQPAAKPNKGPIRSLL